MPVMGEGRDFFIGKAAELAAHEVQGLVQPGIAVEARAIRLDHPRQGNPRLSRGCFCEQPGCGVSQRINRVLRHAHIRGPQDFALAHGQAAGQFGHIFADGESGQRLFHRRRRALALHAGQIVRKLGQRLHIGCRPGQAVRRDLLALKQSCIHLAAGGHAGRHRLPCRAQIGAGSLCGSCRADRDAGRGGGG